MVNYFETNLPTSKGKFLLSVPMTSFCNRLVVSKRPFWKGNTNIEPASGLPLLCAILPRMESGVIHIQSFQDC